MIDSGLIIKNSDDHMLNIVFAKDKDVYVKYKNALPDLRSEYASTNNRIRDLAYTEMKRSMPAHLDSQLKDFAMVIANYTIAPLIIKSAIESGFLKSPAVDQEKSISILIGQFE
jgi:hypothetical protein